MKEKHILFDWIARKQKPNNQLISQGEGKKKRNGGGFGTGHGDKGLGVDTAIGGDGPNRSPPLLRL